MASAATLAARRQLYLSRARLGKQGGRAFAFYSGKPTEPTSYTGNMALGTFAGGVGAGLADGVGVPLVQVVPCNEPLISAVQVTVLAENVRVRVTYQDPDVETDVYAMFVPGGGITVAPVSVSEGPAEGQVTLLFPAEDLLPGGHYTLRVMRSSNPTGCFDIEQNILEVASFVCTLTITNMTGDGIDPNPWLDPGDLDQMVTVTGTGFLAGTILVSLPQVGGGPDEDLPIDSVNVINDTTLEIQFDTLLTSDGTYGVTISFAEDPECTASYGGTPEEPGIDVINE